MENRRRDPVPTVDTLNHFHERPVLITASEGAPIANGKLVVVGERGNAPAEVHLEFVARTVNFVLPVPAAQLFRLAGTWNGSHFVYALPPGEQLWLQPPADGV